AELLGLLQGPLQQLLGLLVVLDLVGPLGPLGALPPEHRVLGPRRGAAERHARQDRQQPARAMVSHPASPPCEAENLARPTGERLQRCGGLLLYPRQPLQARNAGGPMTEVRLMTLDPGHFHAALVQKEMYAGVSRRAQVYAPLGPDLAA